MRLRTVNDVICFFGLFLGLAIAAPAQSFDIIDAPNAFSTYPQNINASGDVTGIFSDVTLNGKSRGFVRDRNGNFTVFDAPNAFGTESKSINARGDVTGYFLDGSQNGRARGFVRDRHGNITVFDAANALNTYPESINASGDVAGEFVDMSRKGGPLCVTSRETSICLMPPMLS
jgi:hypothetical protein